MRRGPRRLPLFGSSAGGTRFNSRPVPVWLRRLVACRQLGGMRGVAGGLGIGHDLELPVLLRRRISRARVRLRLIPQFLGGA
jgi:hypothetical protein